MNRLLKGRKPSPALIVAVVALSAALVGTAIAAPIAGISLSKKEKKQTVKIARKQANKVFNKRRGQLVGPQGPKGDTGPKGEKGATGAQGPKGDTGAAGSAVAYAKVNADGTVDASLSKNVTSANVQHAGTGAYCFHDLSFTPKNAIATLLNFDNGEITAGVAPDIGSVCTVGSVNARVETYNDSGAIKDSAFSIVFN